MKKNYLQYVMGYHNAFLVSHIMGSNLLVRISVLQCDWENKMPEGNNSIIIRIIRYCYQIVTTSKGQVKFKRNFSFWPIIRLFFSRKLHKTKDNLTKGARPNFVQLNWKKSNFG